MDIQTISHREDELLDLDGFVNLALFVLEVENAPDQCEVSIAVVDIEEMTSLNEQYRDKTGPTDVLSFPCDDPTDMSTPDQPITLGDIIIAPDIALSQAAEYGHTAEEELNLLLVHGVLHLLGYDHIEDDEASVMQARERSILEAWALRA